jgi:hypothetical protein
MIRPIDLIVFLIFLIVSCVESKDQRSEINKKNYQTKIESIEFTSAGLHFQTNDSVLFESYVSIYVHKSESSYIFENRMKTTNGDYFIPYESFSPVLLSDSNVIHVSLALFKNVEPIESIDYGGTDSSSLIEVWSKEGDVYRRVKRVGD